MTQGITHNFNGSSLQPGQLQLDIQAVSLAFGGVSALTNISLQIYQGNIVAIIGPNGAGKTSLLNCLSGLYRPQEGQILFFNHNQTHQLTKLAPYKIAQIGVARSFQNIELFKHMTVLDNLMLGRHIHLKSTIFDNALFWFRTRKEEIANRKYVEDIIDLLEIQAIRKKAVGTLAYGLQKRVELGRALALQPAILLIDEPMAGMNSEEKEDMARFILDINEEHGVTIALIEHDMGVVMDICDQIAVLDFGRKIGEGSPREVQQNKAVIKAYLGENIM